MKTQMVKFDFTKTPKGILEYLNKKGYLLTFDYDELIAHAHHKTFTVAKVTRADLLNDIFKALSTSLESGQNFKQFKEEILPTLEKKGWWGKKEIINPITGEVKKVTIDSRRLRTIYHTNMRVSYQQYRYKQMMQLPLSTFWMYRSALLENTRDSHRALHQTVLPRDHSFWNVNYPPNDWNCKCTVTAHSQKDLDKRGLKVAAGKIDNIASKDWAYNIGDTSKVSSISKLNLAASLASLKSLTNIKDTKLKDLSEEGLKKRFYKTLAIAPGDVFIDKVNDPMIIDDNLFKAASGHSKIKKRDRHLYLDTIADTITNPDEIYLEFNEKEQRLVKKMFRYFKEADKKKALLVIFEYLEDKTQGVSAYVVDSTNAVEKKRFEKLIYQKSSLK